MVCYHCGSSIEHKSYLCAIRARATDPDNRDYNADETEFLRAIDRLRTSLHGRTPTWAEALNVLLALGYRKAPSISGVFPA